MKKVFAIAAIILIGFSAGAQVQRKAAVANDTTARESTGDLSKKPTKRQLLLELNLSKEQKQQLKEILQAGKSSRAEIMNDQMLTDDQKQDKLKEVRRATAFNLQGILSVDQKLKLKALRRDVKNRKMDSTDNPEKDF